MPRFRLTLPVFLIGLGVGFLVTGGSLVAVAQNLCKFNSAGDKIQHVIYIQFDNIHLRRDNPNVPSDLEQMPHLLGFLTNQGTLSGSIS